MNETKGNALSEKSIFLIHKGIYKDIDHGGSDTTG